MIITVRVNPHAKRNAVEMVNETEYKVSVTVVPEHGKANTKVIALLAKYFHTAKSNITILAGETSKLKRLEVTE